MGKLVENFWDCKYCNTTSIKGRYRECPNCSKPRDKNTKFKLPTEITYVPEDEAKKINRNPDWLCKFCCSLNSDDYCVCKSCGAERTSDNLDYFSNKLKRNLKSKSSNIKTPLNITETIKNTSDEYLHEDTSKTFSANNEFYTTTSSNFFKSNWKKLIIIPIIISLILGLIYLLIPKEETITIENFKWERSIEIQRYQTVKESGWSLPSNARLLHSNLEFSHYQQVLDHYETRTRQVAKQRLVGYEEYVTGYRDLGNGYSEEITAQRPIYETYYETETYQEPVYRNQPIYLTKYYYEIDKWLYERSISTNGKDHNSYWGEVTLNTNERIGQKNESYYIIGKNKKGKPLELKLNYKDWCRFNIKQTIKVKISVLGTCELIE